MKHYLPGIEGRVTASMCGGVLCVSNICVSAHNVYYVSVNLSVFGINVQITEDFVISSFPNVP